MPASSASTSRRQTRAEAAHNPEKRDRIPESDRAQKGPQTQSGTAPKYDPAIRFYQYAGATIAHQQTQAHPATPRRFGQVNNM